jgi:hypothetical protein
MEDVYGGVGIDNGMINDGDGVGQGNFSGFKSANILYENLEHNFVLI